MNLYSGPGIIKIEGRCRFQLNEWWKGVFSDLFIPRLPHKCTLPYTAEPAEQLFYTGRQEQAGWFAEGASYSERAYSSEFPQNHSSYCMVE